MRESRSGMRICVIDEVRVTAGGVSYSLDGGVYMHGKHSWRVEGSSDQDVMVGQLLSKEVVEYVRNRKDGQNRGVCFSFWYRPELVQSNSSRIHLFRPRIGGLCCKTHETK